MCGLVGRIDLDGIDRDAVAPGLARALARLGPRGPDARGQWVDDRAALGHTRLAIIDLSPGGLQPMQRHGLTITYNGEIYNYRALRDELCHLGHRFNSDSDTEVVLAGWQQWGPALLPRLTGMFAFLLWDPARGRAVLARDRFGLKPLVYTTGGRRLAAASDLVALAAVAPWVGDLDPVALRLFFALRYIPDPWTIRPGARKLPPGHMAVFEDSRLTLSRWYDLRTARPARPPATPAEGAAELRRRVDAAVADRLVADVPVGAFLSGGIDSAIITAAMAAHGIRPRTFTVGFAGATDYYEERPAARAVADHLGTDHTDIELDPATALAAVPDVLAATDEPFADSSALPTWLLARETRAHVTVALSGDGADELFGGYRKHRGELWAARYQRLPALLRRGVVEPLAGLLPDGKGHPLQERARRLRRFVAHAGGSPAARQAGWARLLGDPDLDRLLGPAPDDTATPETLVADRRGDRMADWAADWDGDGINAMLAGEVGLGLAGDMLVKVDRMSMAHALEVRCPFTDQRVAEWAAALPGAWKLGPAGGKLVLRDAFRDRLPAAVFERPKKGFEVPIDRWLAGPLAPLLDRALDPGRLRRQGLVNPDVPAAWRAALLSGRRDTSWQLWAMLAFSHWVDTLT